MRRRRLLWQIYPAYLLIILFCLLSVTWFASRSLRQFFLEQAAADLEARASLLNERVAEFLRQEDSAALADFCRRMGAAAATRITIIDPDGVVLADSRQDPALMDNHANRPEVIEARAGRTGTKIRYSRTLKKNMMYVAVPVRSVGERWAVLRTSLPLTTLSQALQTVYLEIFLSGLVLALLAAAASYWVARRISRPLQELERGARLFAQGDLDHELAVPDSEEIGALAEAMNRMATQLDDRFDTIVEHRQKLEAILASMAEGVLAVNADREIITLNRAGADFLDLTADQALGRTLEEVVRIPELIQLVDEAMVKDEPIASEIGLYGARELHLQAQAASLKGADGRKFGVLIVLNDVTRLLRLENLRRDFVANVSHELKTPITSIKGFVETLLNGALQNPEDSVRFLGIIANHADRLQAIVEDLLSLSRIEQETEEEEVVLTEGPLRDPLEDAVQSIAPAAAEKGISLKLICDGDLQARFSDQLIEQAVLNLVDNAVKYSPAGSTVRIEARQAASAVEILVQDSGCGIAAEHLSRLFERFYRVDKARSRKLGGTGLGLAIVKHIAQAHGGEVRVDSVLGKGSTFTIVLPGERRLPPPPSDGPILHPKPF